MNTWLGRVANCSAVSISIVFAGLCVMNQFNGVEIGLKGTVALAVGISLTNVVAIILMDLVRENRHRAEPPRFRSHTVS
jgi:hypothetical protein